VALEREVQIRLRIVDDGVNVRTARAVGAAAESAARQTIAAAAKAAREQERSAQSAARATAQAARQQALELRQLQATASTAAAGRVQAEAAVLEASKRTLQGVLSVAEGVAKLGLLSEESLRKFIVTFVAVQEGFRVFRGGVDIVIGLTQAMRAYQQATQSAAAAQTALAAAQTLTGSTAAASGTATATAATATGVGAATLGAGGLLAVFKSASTAIAAVAAKAAAVTAVLAVLVEGVSRLGRLVGYTAESWGEFIFGSQGLFATWRRQREASERVQRAESALAEARERAAARDRLIEAAAERQSALRGELRGLAAEAIAVGGLDPLEQARRARLRALSELEQAEAGVEAAAQRNLQRQTSGEVFSFADQLAALERLRSARQEIVAADRASVEAIRQQVDERRRSVAVAEQELQRARDLVRAEQDRVTTATARFGRLDPVQQERARRIAQQGGPRTAAEAGFLEQIGLGTRLAESFFAARGREAGAEQVLAGLGEMDRLRQAQEAQRMAIEADAAARQAERQAVEQLTAAQLRLLESLERLPQVLKSIAEVQSERDRLPEAGAREIVHGIEGLAEEIVDALRDARARVARDRQVAAANQF